MRDNTTGVLIAAIVLVIALISYFAFAPKCDEPMQDINQAGECLR